MSEEFKLIKILKVNLNILKVSFNWPLQAVSYSLEPLIILTILNEYGTVLVSRADVKIQLPKEN